MGKAYKAHNMHETHKMCSLLTVLVLRAEHALKGDVGPAPIGVAQVVALAVLSPEPCIWVAASALAPPGCDLDLVAGVVVVADGQGGAHEREHGQGVGALSGGQGEPERRIDLTYILELLAYIFYVQ